MKNTDPMHALAAREARIKSFATRTLAVALNNIERLIPEIADEAVRDRFVNEHGMAQESMAILFAPGSEVSADTFEALTDFDTHPRQRGARTGKKRATKPKAKAAPRRSPTRTKVATPAGYTLVGNKTDHPARRKYECDCGRKIKGIGPISYHVQGCDGKPKATGVNRVAQHLAASTNGNGTH